MINTDATTRSSARCNPRAVALSARPWIRSSTAPLRSALAHQAIDMAVAGATVIRATNRYPAISEVGDRLRRQQAKRDKQEQVECTARPAGPDRWCERGNC